MTTFPTLTAWDCIKLAAEVLQEKDPTLTEAAAVVKVIDEHPDLAREYQATRDICDAKEQFLTDIARAHQRFSREATKLRELNPALTFPQAMAIAQHEHPDWEARSPLSEPEAA